MPEPLLPLLKKLRLSGMSQSLEIRLHEASSSSLLRPELFVRNCLDLNDR